MGREQVPMEPGTVQTPEEARFAAYVLGQRVAVWEVVGVYREAKSIARTADHFGRPEYLVKCALAYAKQYPDEIAAQQQAEVGD